MHSRSTHRPADEEHGDGPDQGQAPDQGLQDHTQLPVQLRKTERELEGGLKHHALSHFLPSQPYLDSFHPGFAEVLFDFHVNLHISRVAAKKKKSDNRR